MKYKAVIFDLDGTLVNSIYDIADAMNTVLRKRNFNTYDYETYKTFVGHGVRSLILQAVPESPEKAKLVDVCLTEMLDIYSSCCTDKTAPYPGVLKLLDDLKSKNIKLAILSNKEDSLTKKVAKAILPDYVYPTLGLVEEALKKPNPQVLLELCKTLNVTPEECMYVGDTKADIQVAKNADMVAVGVSWGFRDKEELVKEGAHFIINTPADLLEIL
ncbi:HAD family hydrolase [Seonamhaeicola aphaedonensis]|uniref:phosphoglycolate phosphatase n=1 Tax=Seonamhaeicola aphaedonensis TaxID=1461338 RepID=A0A3D9HGQ6_9FLAO|nr:HAD family hydrolase [Seonamhaeicola aphaedonensis]RED48186.1 phosphoglycolate phosphatase [Seonamhaeicola aphaedonensis]